MTVSPIFSLHGIAGRDIGERRARLISRRDASIRQRRRGRRARKRTMDSR
jgi:hypothetical protein